MARKAIKGIDAPELTTKAGTIRKRVPICAAQGSSGNEYRISLCDGQWQCSCPAWTRHTPRADCKHIGPVKLALRRWAALNGTVPLQPRGWRPEPALAEFIARHFGPTGTPDDAGFAFLALVSLAVDEAPVLPAVTPEGERAVNETAQSAWHTAMQLVFDDAQVAP